MRFEQPGNPEQEQLERLAASAEAHRKTWEPPHHIWKALDENGFKGRSADERAAWYKKVHAELAKREHRAKKADLPFSEREDLIEDARIAELKHPKEDEDEA